MHKPAHRIRVARRQLWWLTKEAGRSPANVNKVKELKKLLNQGKPVKILGKKFKITDTQILQIKKGISWGKVQAAK